MKGKETNRKTDTYLGNNLKCSITLANRQNSNTSVQNIEETRSNSSLLISSNV